jgi:hypothetical protein
METALPEKPGVKYVGLGGPERVDFHLFEGLRRYGQERFRDRRTEVYTRAACYLSQGCRMGEQKMPEPRMYHGAVTGHQGRAHQVGARYWLEQSSGE